MQYDNNCLKKVFLKITSNKQIQLCNAFEYKISIYQAYFMKFKDLVYLVLDVDIVTFTVLILIGIMCAIQHITKNMNIGNLRRVIEFISTILILYITVFKTSNINLRLKS